MMGKGCGRWPLLPVEGTVAGFASWDFKASHDSPQNNYRTA